MGIQEFEQENNIISLLNNCKSCYQTVDIDCQTKVKITQLYWKHAYNMVWNGFKWCHASYTIDEIEELRNELFYKLMKNQCKLLKQFDSTKGSFYNWISNIAKNFVKDYLKYRRLRIMEGIEFEIKDDTLDNTIINNMINEEKKLLIQKVKESTLNTKEINVIDGTYKDYSDQEIANEMGIKKNYVQQIRYRAINKLKQKVETILGLNNYATYIY